MASSKVDIYPHKMEGFISNAMHVLEHGDHVPKACFKACSGILLVSAREGGFIISGESGAGVAMLHKDGDWSNPIAMTLDSVGWGAGIGVTDKDIMIFLDPLAMKRLLEGNFEAKLGADVGFACGPVGNIASAEIEASEKLGGGTSFAYTWAKGVMLNVEVQTGAIVPHVQANKAFYDTPSPKDILLGKASVPEAGKPTVDGLKNKLNALKD